LRPIVLLLVAALLLIQPAVQPVGAQESGQVEFVVGGVAGATLRAEPNGTSNVLATVPPGSVVSQVGADVTTSGVVWRQVRTADGVVGYLPAGFLVAIQVGGTYANAPTNAGSADQAPAGSVGAASQAGPSAANAPANTAARAPAPSQPVAYAPSNGSQPSNTAQTSAAPQVARPGGQSVGQVASATAAPSATAATAQGAADPSSTTVASANPSGTLGEARTSATGVQQVAAPTASPTASAQSETTESVPSKNVHTTTKNVRGQDVEVTQLDEETAPDGRPMVAGRILVGFKPGVASATKQDAHRVAGTLATSGVGLSDVSVADVAPGNVAQALAAYRSRPDVAWAEPDYIKRATLIPNDPLFSQQYGPQKISAPAAWDVTKGAASTKVAILDCGIFSESSGFTSPDGLPGHPDLRGKVVGEINFTASTHGADDYCNHGTLMAGVAGARTNTSPAVGVAGIGFNVSLLNGKVLDDLGDGSDSGVASGIIWATDSGARVISMSLGGPGACSNTLQAAVDYAWARNVVMIAAAGNGGDDQIGDPAPESPGNCNHVVAVAATDQNDQRASFSNYGLAVPLAAPGVSILSTNFVGGYSTVSGTSPATPHVSGVAGLLWSTVYATSNQAIVNRLLSTADPIAGTGTLWANGRVNAASAVASAPVVSCSPRPPVSITTSPAPGGRFVTITVSGAGNTLQYVSFLNFAAATTNAQTVAFSAGSTSSQTADGTLTLIPTTSAAQQTFVLKRAAAGQPTTLKMIVHDACGAWQTFIGGGTSAGF
jgi:thermitase